MCLFYLKFQSVEGKKKYECGSDIKSLFRRQLSYQGSIVYDIASASEHTTHVHMDKLIW